MAVVSMRQMIEAGAHFGHQTRRWNPKMRRFIFGERNGIYVIDLDQTLARIETAYNFLRELAADGGTVLFVGTKKQAQEAVKEAAKTCGQSFVTERWLGGTLTNFKTVKRSMARMKEIERMEQDGSINQYVKQEQSMIRREHQRLLKNLDGLRQMDIQPDAMFVVDIKREHNAVAEARRLKVPIVAITDTNCDPDLVDYPIAGNDDAIRSVKLILGAVVEAVSTARAEYEAKRARKAPEAEAPAAAPAAPVESVPAEPAPEAVSPSPVA